MGGKPSADSSGMMMAMISAQAGQQAYSLGEQQLQWAKDVWSQEQPLITQAEQTQIDLAKQQEQVMQTQEAQSRAMWDQYQQYFAPLQQQVATQAQDWAAPQAMALATGQAESGVAENVQQGINTAKESLMNYGVNPNAPEFAGLMIGANTVGAAAEAGAGTQAAQNLRNQQVQLEQSAAGLGSTISGQSGSLAQVGSQAGGVGAQSASGAAGTAQQNLATGSSAYTAPVNWFNTGAANMNVYTNAVAQYNQSQYEMASLGASELGSAMKGIGDLVGWAMPGGLFHAKGGPIEKYQDGGPTGMPSSSNGISNGSTGMPPPSGGTPGGFVTPDQSPSGGQQTDDVDAKLTVGEFVMPKDVVHAKGTEFFYGLIDKTRNSMQQNESRDDIGGEQVSGIPMGPPAFVSRPQGAQPQPPQIRPQPIPNLSGMPPSGMPSRPMMPPTMGS